MVSSLLSLALNVPVKPNVAMTGEVTLMGKVLAIGGVKEKTIAAKRSGVKTLVFPIDNKKDVEELPDYIKKGVEFTYADYYKDVFRIAFDKLPEKTKAAIASTKSTKSSRVSKVSSRVSKRN
jgi:Lon-like ATP-dependent protease